MARKDGRTPTASATATALVALTPIADAYVDKARPATNFGSDTVLKVEGPLAQITYMKFDLSVAPVAGGSISSAKLALNIANSSSQTQNVKLVENTVWAETGLTYNTRPVPSTTINTMNGGSAGSWIEVDVTAAVLAKQGRLLSLAIDTMATDALYFYSKEGVNKPQLIVAYADVPPTPAPVPPPAPAPMPPPAEPPPPDVPPASGPPSGGLVLDQAAAGGAASDGAAASAPTGAAASAPTVDRRDAGPTQPPTRAIGSQGPTSQPPEGTTSRGHSFADYVWNWWNLVVLVALAGFAAAGVGVIARSGYGPSLAWSASWLRPRSLARGTASQSRRFVVFAWKRGSLVSVAAVGFANSGVGAIARSGHRLRLARPALRPGLRTLARGTASGSRWFVVLAWKWGSLLFVVLAGIAHSGVGVTARSGHRLWLARPAAWLRLRTLAQGAASQSRRFVVLAWKWGSLLLVALAGFAYGGVAVIARRRAGVSRSDGPDRPERNERGGPQVCPQPGSERHQAMSSTVVEFPQKREASQSLIPWLALLPLMLIPVFGHSAEGLDRLILITQGALLFFGTRRPIWILAALLVSELTINNYIYTLGGVEISNRLLLALVSIPLIAPHLASGTHLGPRAKSMLVVAVSFVLLAGFANHLYSDGGYTAKFGRFLFTALIALILVPVAVKDRTDLRDLSIVALAVGAVSAFLAVLQHYSQFTSMPLYQTVPYGTADVDFAGWGGRALGLTENPIYLTNAGLLVAMPLLGVILLTPMESRQRLGLLGIFLMILSALFFSFTRSWTYSIALGIAGMGLLYRGKYQREFLIVGLLGAAMFLYWSDAQGSRYTQSADEDSSAATRPVLWDVALKIAMDHPVLGVGHDAFLKLAPQYADRVDQDLLQRQGAGSALGVYQPHNDWLNVWLSFGVGALVLYVLLFVLTIKNCVETVLRSEDLLLKGLALGALGAVLAYGMNSSFHNLFDSTLTLWLLAGFSLALTKLVTQNSAPPVVQSSNGHP